MNYIACADLHIRSNKPQFRKDDYFLTLCDKVKQIVILCNKHNADLIIAGDIFDHIKVGHKVVNTLIRIFRKLKGKIFVVAGQHDMSFHTRDLISSPLLTLVYTGKMKILKRVTPYHDGENYIYGCSYNETPVKPEFEKWSMLVIHRTITPDDPPFFLKDAISAEQALDTYEGYYLIISGDYHQSFCVSKWGNVLINCGPMVRQSIDQMDLEPKVWLITDAEVTSINLKIKPAQDVFALENIKRKEESEFSKGLTELVDTLKDEAKGPDYKSNVDMLMRKSNISKYTENKVNELFGRVIDERA